MPRIQGTALKAKRIPKNARGGQKVAAKAAEATTAASAATVSPPESTRAARNAAAAAAAAKAAAKEDAIMRKIMHCSTAVDKAYNAMTAARRALREAESSYVADVERAVRLLADVTREHHECQLEYFTALGVPLDTPLGVPLDIPLGA